MLICLLAALVIVATTPVAGKDNSMPFLFTQILGAGSGTNNTIPKWTGTNSIGNSSITDNGTTVSTTGAVDFSGASSFKTPIGASLQPTISGLFAYDSVANRFGGGVNGIYKVFVHPDSTDTLTGKSFDTAGTGNVLKINGTAVTTVTGAGNMVLATSPTLTTPSFSSIINTGTLTLPTSTDTLVGRATADTFTNKTFDTGASGNSFKIAGTSITVVTGTGSAVLATSPTLTTPNIGVATGTSLFVTGDITVGSSNSLKWGTTNTVPQLQASGTTIQALLGDGSTFAPMRASALGLQAAPPAAGILLGSGNIIANPSGIIGFGTTNTAAAINSSGTLLQVVLGDVSGFASLRASSFGVGGTAASNVFGWNANTGLSSSAAGQVSVGNGTASDRTGQLLAGGIAPNINATAKTGAYTVASSDGTILNNSTAGTFVETLPAANGVPAGRIFYFLNIGTANQVTITCAGADLVKDGSAAGAATYALAFNSRVALQSDGASLWYVISK